MSFKTEDGVSVPAVTANQMREVDRIAVEKFGLDILQMMENTGRSLAAHVMDMLGAAGGAVMILAGAGGNGGGGICCARHLLNRGFKVWLVIDKRTATLTGAALTQLQTVRMIGLRPLAADQANAVIDEAQVVVDALIGYGLRGAARGKTAELIELCNARAARVLSLDVPSGIDATTGEQRGPVIHPERTLTLALPKTGLRRAPGALYVADIGIPPEVYAALGLSVPPFFGSRYWVRLVADETNTG